LEYLIPHVWDGQQPHIYMIPELRREMEAQDLKKKKKGKKQNFSAA
jgi:hypothetical protein